MKRGAQAAQRPGDLGVTSSAVGVRVAGDEDLGCAGLGGSFKCCGNSCVDVSKSTANCGRCGAPCSPDHGVGGCSAGTCALSKCLDGWGDCDMKPDNGCETNLHIDANNCTACGMKCSIANAVVACSNGCYLSACQFGWDDCDGDVKNGCEKPVLTDAKNCGACGQSCGGLPHAGGTCQTGICVPQCDQGYGDCDGNQMNGCEASIGIDAKNCGRCGNVCPQGLVCQNSSCTCPQCNFPNAKSQCVNNQCMFDSCFTGFGNCDNNTANGCEVDFTSDDKNCGACGTVCPMNLPHCSASTCTNAPVLVGKFNVSDGPAWGGNPPTYTCQEACAKVFGGTANQYQCSTIMGSVNRMANSSIWGVGGCAVVADTFKKNTAYNCGAANCAQSAYVSDNCSPGTNYCFK